jgi:hypothetical protein
MMTEHEFIIWLKGFVEACPEFHPTPKQWDRLKEKLDQVSNKTNSITVETCGTTFFSSTPRYDVTNVPHGTQINYTTTKQQLND